MEEQIEVTALALLYYPGPEREKERAAFVQGYYAANPSSLPKPKRWKWGTRTAFLGSIEPGQTVQVPFISNEELNRWKSLASHNKRVFGCKFRIERDRKDITKLNITRDE